MNNRKPYGAVVEIFWSGHVLKPEVWSVPFVEDRSEEDFKLG